MSQYIILAIIIVLVIAFVVFVASIYLLRKEREHEAEVLDMVIGASAGKRSTGSGTRLIGLRNRFFNRKSRQAEQFQLWAVENVASQTDEGLKDWLVALPPEEARNFTTDLAVLCRKLYLDLNWLLDGELKRDPALEDRAKALVLSYCRTRWQATLSKADLVAFGTFKAITRRPSKKEHRLLSRKLFADLASQNMANGVSPALYQTKGKKQHEYIMGAIEQAAASDWVKFRTILKGVLNNEKRSGNSWTGRMFMRGDPALEAPEGELSTAMLDEDNKVRTNLS